MTTTTGRQASTTACQASFGARRSSSTDAEIIGAGSASHEKQKPPVGRYFRRRSVSMWWRRIAAWLRCVAIRQASNVGWSSGGMRWAITSTSSPWCSRSASQSSAGQRDASTNSAARSGTDWAPNSLTNRTRRGSSRATSASSAASPRCQPSHMCESVPSSWGRCGATPPWATVGRVGSACSNDRFTHRSSTDLFHVGSCCTTNRRRRLARRSVSTCGASAIGSSWAHHCTMDGWWPSESTASRAWRTASLRIWRAYPHCSGKSCSRSMPSSSAARYSS